MFRRRWLGVVASATVGTAGCAALERDGQRSRRNDSDTRRTDGNDRRDEPLASRLGYRGLEDSEWEISDPETDGNTVTLSATDDSDERIVVTTTVYDYLSEARVRYQRRRNEVSTEYEDVRDFESVDLGDEGFQYRRHDYKASVVFRIGTAVTVVDHDWQTGGSIPEAREFATLVEASLRESDAVSSD